MRKKINKIYLVLLVVAFFITGCDKTNLNMDDIRDIETSQTNDGKDDGYFIATLIPGFTNSDAESRTPIKCESTAIQSLLCIIYQQNSDGQYVYYTEKEVIDFQGSSYSLIKWPLEQQITFSLPNGNYKAVFVGNIDNDLFEGQNENALLTNYKAAYDEARLNMPENGPAAFNDYNMFYLATADFSNENKNPYIILQRIVTNTIIGRDFVDTNKALKMLVENIVKEIEESQLTTEVVKGLLHSAILDKVSTETGLDTLLGQVTGITDRIVNLILSDIVTYLHNLLLDKVLEQLETALGGESGLVNLGYLLNPWTHAGSLNITFEQLPKSINLDRQSMSYYRNIIRNNISTIHDRNNNAFSSFVALSGTQIISKIEINADGLLSPILNKIDEALLNSLLINIEVPLNYTTGSNLQYNTRYELVDLMLKDYSSSEDSPLKLSIDLSRIIKVREFVEALIGDNIISGLIGALTDDLVQPLINALNAVVLALDIKLPGLGIDNIQLSGSWDATYVSDGTIAR